ncbi:MAG: ABC transporter ATP-binding protein [Lachnospiraceae bacterium]|jgi:putative ABC transport system ATP-binding protein|nr:ABC transporter ATP-binding protein [Lachnospiraceae bacterium]
MSILSTTHLTKQYGSGPNIVNALDDVNISVEQGEFVAIIGTSGSGKSTLLNMLGGLDRPTSGSVRVDKFELGKLSDEDLTVFRRQRIGFVFQNYNLVPILNVYENIIMPIQLDNKKPDERFIQEVVELLGLEKKLNNMPNTLSGGQQQRVSIARALASKPAIILADEPTGNLDSKTSNEVIELLRITSQKFHQTIVMITHNPEIAKQADRCIRIEDGKVASAQEGRADV